MVNTLGGTSTFSVVPRVARITLDAFLVYFDRFGTSTTWIMILGSRVQSNISAKNKQRDSDPVEDTNEIVFVRSMPVSFTRRPASFNFIRRRNAEMTKPF